MATVAPPGTDTRFTAIEDAAALLRLLPAAEHIAWPVDAGDVIAVDEALRLIAGWLPVARKSWNLHKRELRGMRAVISGSDSRANRSGEA